MEYYYTKFVHLRHLVVSIQMGHEQIDNTVKVGIFRYQGNVCTFEF